MLRVEFGAARPAFPTLDAIGSIAPFRSARRSERPRLALISTYNELCGIAAYTRSLEKQLADVFDVTVFELDQYLLRSKHGRVKKFGDRHIQEICREIREFDNVNLQLEFGTLGYHYRDIFRRFTWIVRSARKLSVTFHTMFEPPAFHMSEFLREIFRLNLTRAIALRAEYNRRHMLSAGVAGRLRRAQRFKPISVIVHTRRDCAHMKYIHGIRNVYDHPLSFLNDDAARQIRREAARSQFPILDSVPADSRLIGVFGFLGKYKGFDTAIRALHHLPQDYHLLIFGGVHPNEIKPHQPVDPVVSTLFDAGYIDTSIAERPRSNGSEGAPALSVALDHSMRDLLIGHPKDLSGRVHFLGATNDADFLAGMSICDAVVFPYIEVGQSSSGPISQALELGCRIIASRTHAFLQFGRYHQNMIEYFDIGNHLELAARIATRPQYDLNTRLLNYNCDTNQAVYQAANGSVTGANPFSPGRKRDPFPMNFWR